MDKINYDNLTAQELKEQLTKNALTLQSLSTTALEKLLAYETELLCHGSGDMELITCCSELLTAKENYETKTLKTTPDFASLVDKTLKDHVEVINPHQTQPKHTQKQRRFSLKHIAIIAAAIIISTSIFVISTTSDNYHGWNLIKDKEVGYSVEYNGFTYTKAGPPQYYNTIEELKEAENLTDWDFLYPTKLPEDLVIERFSISYNKRTIKIECNKNYFKNYETSFFYVEKDVPFYNTWNDLTGIDNYIYEINGIAFRVFTYGGNYNAACWYNGDYYFIKANTEEDLILIIENLK